MKTALVAFTWIALSAAVFAGDSEPRLFTSCSELGDYLFEIVELHPDGGFDYWFRTKTRKMDDETRPISGRYLRDGDVITFDGGRIPHEKLYVRKKGSFVLLIDADAIDEFDKTGQFYPHSGLIAAASSAKKRFEITRPSFEEVNDAR